MSIRSASTGRCQARSRSSLAGKWLTVASLAEQGECGVGDPVPGLPSPACVPGSMEAMTTGVLVLFALDDLGVGEAGYAVPGT
jgi:hypothetical protein